MGWMGWFQIVIIIVIIHPLIIQMMSIELEHCRTALYGIIFDDSPGKTVYFCFDETLNVWADLSKPFLFDCTRTVEAEDNTGRLSFALVSVANSIPFKPGLALKIYMI
jgi:hypothetical protein